MRASRVHLGEVFRCETVELQRLIVGPVTDSKAVGDLREFELVAFQAQVLVRARELDEEVARASPSPLQPGHLHRFILLRNTLVHACRLYRVGPLTLVARSRASAHSQHSRCLHRGSR